MNIGSGPAQPNRNMEQNLHWLKRKEPPCPWGGGFTGAEPIRMNGLLRHVTRI